MQLHLAGFFWGDCSLSNTLFRRDAGALAAYLVDAETGEQHERLTDGQRSYDLEIATYNIAGEMFDLQAAGLLNEDVDVADVRGARWSPATSACGRSSRTSSPSRSARTTASTSGCGRLNALGFDVSEIAAKTEPDGLHVRFDTQVVDPGHHKRRIFALTGLRVQENEARTLLADLARFKAKYESGTGRTIDDAAAARRWMSEKFYGTLNLVPPELRVKLSDAELFHEISEHRWLLSEAQGYDVGRSAAVASYVGTVLRDLPDTRVEISSGPPTEEFEPIFE